MTSNGSDQTRELPEETIEKVSKAAAQGAKQILGPGSPDIEEIVAEVSLLLVRRWKDNPPTEPDKWAFIVAINLAKRVGRKMSERVRNHVELTDNLHLATNEPGNSEPTIAIEEGLEALDRLMEITNHTIHDVGKDIDRRIFVLLHVRGLGIEEIAATVGLSTAAVNRRYYRLIQQVTGLVRERAKKDPHLNRVFEAILVDDQLFRCSLLGLLNVISRKGFSAIRQILESFLS